MFSKIAAHIQVQHASSSSSTRTPLANHAIVQIAANRLNRHSTFGKCLRGSSGSPTAFVVKNAAEPIRSHRVTAESLTSHKCSARTEGSQKNGGTDRATDRVATDRVATDRVATDRVATDRVATDRVATMSWDEAQTRWRLAAASSIPAASVSARAVASAAAMTSATAAPLTIEASLA